MNQKATLALRGRDVLLSQLTEDLTGLLICAMAVFGPWAFGTTLPWSIWTMNSAGLALGLFLACKLWIRKVKGYHPGRWDEPQTPLPGPFRTSRPEADRETSDQETCRRRAGDWLILGLASLTVSILAWCAISAVNARATYYPTQARLEYHQCIPWLPHSFNSTATWMAFWKYLGLACAFWAVRDWLLGKSVHEAQAPQSSAQDPATLISYPLPGRLRLLLWVLAVNGALLSLECILQRMADSPKLLFLVLPRIHQNAIAQFGPYAYRANAAQYLNLLWPVCIGFWWTLTRASKSSCRSAHLLLVCGAIMAAGSLISTSRGGALVAITTGLVGVFLLSVSQLGTHRHRHRRGTPASMAVVLPAFGVAVLALTAALGWQALKPRLDEFELNTGFASREELYVVARRIAADFPILGTGPGTYEAVSELYRPAELVGRFFPAQVHNDWLETRITFGKTGSLLICAMLGLIVVRWFLSGGIHGGRHLVGSLWLALAGCLVHARYDFPFQIHSILFLFLLLCAVLFTLSRRP